MTTPGPAPELVLPRVRALRHRRRVRTTPLQDGDRVIASGWWPRCPADQLCVATSGSAPIDAAQRDPALDLTPETGVHGYGVSIGVNGQPEVAAQATQVTPDLTAAVARQPEGLLVIDAWLQREQP